MKWNNYQSVWNIFNDELLQNLSKRTIYSFVNMSTKVDRNENDMFNGSHSVK